MKRPFTNHVNHDISYDNWKCYDSLGQQLWDDVYKKEYWFNLAKQEHPYLDEESLEVIAEEMEKDYFYTIWENIG